MVENLMIPASQNYFSISFEQNEYFIYIYIILGLFKENTLTFKSKFNPILLYLNIYILYFCNCVKEILCFTIFYHSIDQNIHIFLN